MFFIKSLIILFFVIILPSSVFSKNLNVAHLEITQQSILELFKKDSSSFTDDNLQFNCSVASSFTKKTQVVLTEKEALPVKEIIPKGKTHQCFFIDKSSPHKMGKGMISVHEINQQKVVSGLLILGKENYFLPPLSVIKNKNISFYSVQSINQNNFIQDLYQDIDVLEEFNTDQKIISKKSSSKKTKEKDRDLRRVKIDVETDAEFLDRFKLEEEIDYDLAIQRALTFIENYYSQISMIKTKAFAVAVEVDRIYLYEEIDPWVGQTRTRLFNDVKSFWNGKGWIYQDSLHRDMIIDQNRDRREDIVENGIQLFLVYVRDNRNGAGVKYERFEKEGLGLVQVLSGRTRGARGHRGGSDPMRALPVIGNHHTGYSIAGLISPESYVDEIDELQLDNIINHTIQGFRTLTNMAHEMGHNFGLDHTHNRGVDRCDCEDNPRTRVNECENFVEVNEPGYLMSYCSELFTEHDPQGIQLFEDFLNQADEEFKSTYLPIIENQAPVIRFVNSPQSINPHLQNHNISIDASDPDDDKIFYEFKFNSGEIIYSHHPEIEFDFPNNFDDHFILNATVYDDKFSKTSQVKNIHDRTLPPENIQLVIKGLNGEVLDPQIAPIGEPLLLSLSFDNLGGGESNCELVLPNGESIHANTIQNNLNLDHYECIFEYQFNFEGHFNFISIIREEIQNLDNLNQVIHQHRLRAEGINDHQAPIIQSIMRILPDGQRSNIFNGDTIENFSIDDRLNLIVNIHDSQGDAVACALNRGDGRPLIRLSEAINNNPQRRICHFDDIEFSSAGLKRASVQIYNVNSIPNRLPDGRWVMRHIRTNFDPIFGTRSFNVQVSESDQRLRISKFLIRDETTNRVYLSNLDRLHQSHNLIIQVRIEGENAQNTNCQYQLNNGEFNQADFISDFGDFIYCNIRFNPDRLGDHHLMVQLVDEDGRIINPIQTQLDINANATNIGGRLNIDLEVIRPQQAFIELLTTLTDNQSDGGVEPKAEDNNIDFKLIFRNPDQYLDEENISCEINFGDGSFIEVDSRRINYAFSECIFDHQYENPDEYRINYSLNRENHDGFGYSSGQKTISIIPEDLPLIGTIKKVIFDENGRSTLMPLRNFEFHMQEVTYYLPIYRSNDYPTICQMNISSPDGVRIENESIEIEPTFNGESLNGFCTFTVSFLSFQQAGTPYHIDFYAMRVDQRRDWHPGLGHEFISLVVR